MNAFAYVLGFAVGLTVASIVGPYSADWMVGMWGGVVVVGVIELIEWVRSS